MNKNNKCPIAILAKNTPERKKPSVYPEPFASIDGWTRKTSIR